MKSCNACVLLLVSQKVLGIEDSQFKLIERRDREGLEYPSECLLLLSSISYFVFQIIQGNDEIMPQFLHSRASSLTKQMLEDDGAQS